MIELIMHSDTVTERVMFMKTSREDERIHAGDMVRNTRTGERLIVAGVNYDLNQFVPMGYPFPSIEKICEYEVVERDAVTVTEHVRNSLRNRHMESYIEPEDRG